MFQITSEYQSARTGILKTSHGKVETPVFMPVATKANVKTLSSKDLDELGTEAIISNALILYLKPGLEAVRDVHDFMNFKNCIFTDSGGMQILNDELLQGIDNNCVKFKSPFDGKIHDFTPELCAEIQSKLGSDVAMVLDDQPHYGKTEEETTVSAMRTVHWAQRFKLAHDNEKQFVFGITQGGVFDNIRKDCTQKLVEMGFDGYAIGGLGIGEPAEGRTRIAKLSNELLPRDKPRYLMGIGSVEDILNAIGHGVDIFDSAFPTRNARHGTLYTSSGKLNIGRKEFESDEKSVDKNCNCELCKNHSLAYLHHLFENYEPTGLRLATIHNLTYMLNLMKEARTAIKEKRFGEFRKSALS